MTPKPLQQPEFDQEQDGVETPPAQQTRFAEELSVVGSPTVPSVRPLETAGTEKVATPKWRKPALIGGGIFLVLMLLVILKPRNQGEILPTPTPSPVGGGQTIKSLSEIERRFALLDRDMEVAEPYAQELSFPPVSFELTLEDATAVQAKSRR